MLSDSAWRCDSYLREKDSREVEISRQVQRCWVPVVLIEYLMRGGMTVYHSTDMHVIWSIVGLHQSPISRFSGIRN